MKTKTPALVLAMMAAAGCSLNRADLRRDGLLTRIGGGGQIIEPKRCALQVAILTRPLRDKGINEAVWSVADEQAIAPEARRGLEANGLRVGQIAGDLPAEVESILNAPPPHKVDPAHVILPSGDHTLVKLCEPTPQVSLLLNREGRASGKDYKDASGFLRITASHVGKTEVSLRIVPEVHHGPVQRGFSALPNGGTLAPQEFMQKDGQQEDCLRELTATLHLQPGQVAVLGCHPERTGSLGTFLFTQPEANSDRLLQKVVLIWATRSSLGLAPDDAKPVPPDLQPVDPPEPAAKPRAGDGETPAVP